jgi:hypothetical protein
MNRDQQVKTSALRAAKNSGARAANLALITFAALVLGAGAAGLAPSLVLASSHGEAPGTSKDRLADDTDLYAFVSKDAPDMVTIVGLWIPLLEPNGGPNFYSFDDDVHYYMNIDNQGDCGQHIRYEFTFRSERRSGDTFLYNTGPVTSLDSPNLNVRQFGTVTRSVEGAETVIAENVPVAPTNIGPASMPDYNTLAQSAVTTLGDGTKIFIGPRDDPFFVDLGSLFDLLTIRKLPGNRKGGIDGVGGYNVMAIVIQVPMTSLTRDGQAPSEGNSVIGIWDDAERLQNRTLNADGTVSVSGPEMQVSRLGMPLVNEVVIPLKDKDKFNASRPSGDGQFLSYVTNPELPVLLNALYGISVPPTPRNDLVAAFLTGVPGLNVNGGTCEMLRLNMAIPPAIKPNRLAVLKGDIAGFPNGRRLTDDVVDIELRVAAGVLVPGFNIKPNNQLGDGVNANDVPLLPYFPYVAPAQSGFAHEHPSSLPGGGDDSDRASLVRDGAGFPFMGAASDDDDDSGAAIDMRTKTPAGTRLQVSGANPASSSRLEFAVPRNAHVTLKVYDARGREVRTLIDQDAAAGRFTAQWDGRDASGNHVSQGVYFARLLVDGQMAQNQKVVRLQ